MVVVAETVRTAPLRAIASPSRSAKPARRHTISGVIPREAPSSDHQLTIGMPYPLVSRHSSHSSIFNSEAVEDNRGLVS